MDLGLKTEEGVDYKIKIPLIIGPSQHHCTINIKMNRCNNGNETMRFK